MLKMALNNILIFYKLFVHKNLSPYVSSWSACINSALSFFLIGFIALTRLSHIIVSVLPMTNWKDSSDGWKDSRHSGQLMAALFSWKLLSYLSPGIQYMFFNSKLQKPVRMPQMAGKTPQSWFEQTNYHCLSMVVHMLLADLFLKFLLPYKGAANFKTDKTQI